MLLVLNCHKCLKDLRMIKALKISKKLSVVNLKQISNFLSKWVLKLMASFKSLIKVCRLRMRGLNGANSSKCNHLKSLEVTMISSWAVKDPNNAKIVKKVKFRKLEATDLKQKLHLKMKLRSFSHFLCDYLTVTNFQIKYATKLHS